jgi:HSP20 family protein
VSLFRRKHEKATVAPAAPATVEAVETESATEVPVTATAGATPEVWTGTSAIEEFRDGETLVVRVTFGGLDPANDIDVTVDNGALNIVAKHREESETTDEGFTRKEMRYGYFARTLPLAADVDASAVTASYHDGTLEVRAPAPAAPAREEAHRIPVTTA